jgi:hypothetical protein
MTPLKADQALDRYFLSVRCKLLEIASVLDRIGRGENSSQAKADQRMQKIRRAFAVLQEGNVGRTERIQQIFSLEYDTAWTPPRPANA